MYRIINPGSVKFNLFLTPLGTGKIVIGIISSSDSSLIVVHGEH